MAILAGGTATAQALLAVSSPVLTRLYSPSDFGALGVFASLLALFSVVSSFRYELAIPLARDDVEAANIVILCLTLVCLMAVISLLLVLVWGGEIAELIGIPALEGLFWLLPLGVLLTGVYTSFSYWAVRANQFEALAKTKVKQTIATIGLQLIGFKLGSTALILAQIAGQSAGAASLARPITKQAAFSQVSLPGVLGTAKGHSRFPIYSTWEGLSNTAGTQLPPLLLAALFGPIAAGLYTLTNRILMLPMSLVGTAVGQVFLSGAAEAHRTGRLGSLVAKIHAQLAHLAMAPALAMMLVGPDIFEIVFGTQWRDAGEFARWMMPWIYLVFVASPLSTLFAVINQQKQGMVFQLVLLIVRVAALIVGSQSGDLLFTIALFAAGSAACWLALLAWISKLAGNALAAIWRPAVSAFGYASLCVSPLGVAKLLGAEGHWLFAASAMAALLIGIRYWRILKQENE